MPDTIYYAGNSDKEIYVERLFIVYSFGKVLKLIIFFFYKFFFLKTIFIFFYYISVKQKFEFNNLSDFFFIFRQIFQFFIVTIFE